METLRVTKVIKSKIAKPMDPLPPQTEIYDLLQHFDLQLTARGFLHLCYAVRLVLKNPDNLCAPDLYAQVAETYHTDRREVREEIDHLVKMAYKRHPEILRALTGEEWEICPTPRQFIGALCRYFLDR